MDREMPRNACCVPLILLGLATSPSFGQETKLLPEAVQMVQARLESQCAAIEDMISSLKREKSFALAIYEGQHFIQCECLPGELKNVVESQPESTRVSEEALVTILRTQSEKCVARGMRQMLARGCDSPDNDDVSEKDRARYCECLSKGVATLSDQQLVESSQASGRDFEAKAKAQRDGTPPPPEEPSPTRAVEASCRRP